MNTLIVDLNTISDSLCLDNTKSPSLPSSNLYRTHFLLNIEEIIQTLWKKKEVYSSSAESIDSRDCSHDINVKKKFFCSFPYPYMNGRLHLGHAYTICKAEFQARFQRLLGNRVLWPFSFHCTGMPIVACADKLKNEINQSLQCDVSEEINMSMSSNSLNENTSHVEKVGFSSKKSKTVAKAEKDKTQFEIMKSIGIPEDVIPLFQDPLYWIEYFVPKTKEDLCRFGLSVDWRRSFITTKRNPYYEAFVRWQFNLLKKRNYLKYGTRPTVYSPKDNQTCADHDRSQGEGVVPQEYTIIKMELTEQSKKDFCNGEFIKFNIYLLAFTLRPETVYGVTNCFISPSMEYGIFSQYENACLPYSPVSEIMINANTKNQSNNLNSLYICSDSSANNMVYQGLLSSTMTSARQLAPICLRKIKGSELIGIEVNVPLGLYPSVYVLPIFNNNCEKSTGIIMSVPSESPDDFIAYTDLKEKSALRSKYNVTEAMVQFNIPEIIDIPNSSKREEIVSCQKGNINSQNVNITSNQVKDKVYKTSYYEGVMLVGLYKGCKVLNIRQTFQEMLMKEKYALKYYEPDSTVISRSGDKCVVAYDNQWYINYSDKEWKEKVLKYITDSSQCNFYSDLCLKQFEHVVSWLNDWACSRTYGLGSYVPWEEPDKKILIESLSDSTIYMAYYTISYLLQGDPFGDSRGELNIDPSCLTDEVFDYIFLQTNTVPVNSKIPVASLETLRNEFSYWYPLDLRVSGKDLIFNHLTMFLFIHVAIWENNDKLWPKSVCCNGHLLIESAKMSKSSGNFLTIEDSLQLYGADATRITLADSGDTVDDANFQKETANSAIMRLFSIESFVNDVCSNKILMRSGHKNWIDIAFENEIFKMINKVEKAYSKLLYRDALKYSFFDFNGLRDTYKHYLGTVEMHEESIKLWIETLCIILSPIAPHITEYMWIMHLKKNNLLVTSHWNSLPQHHYNATLGFEFNYLQRIITDFHKLKNKKLNSEKNVNKKTTSDLTTFTSATVYIAREYPDWQKDVLNSLNAVIQLNKSISFDHCMAEFIKHIKLTINNKSQLAKSIEFAKFKLKEMDLYFGELKIFPLNLEFDEFNFLKDHAEMIKRLLNIDTFIVKDYIHNMNSTDKRLTNTVPLMPTVIFN